jgi:hypothetical protein
MLWDTKQRGGSVQTPAQVIGENVKALRKPRMTAEEFGNRIGEILGKPWPRQMVYLLEQGGRSCTAEDVIAMALVLDVPIADLFIPSMSVDEVQVGHQRVRREQLLTQGEKDSDPLREIARHIQVLLRTHNEVARDLNTQLFVITNIDNALRGKPPLGRPADPPSDEGWPDSQVAWEAVRRQSEWEMARRVYERAQKWYEEESK